MLDAEAMNDLIIDAIQDIKGIDIIKFDLRKLDDAHTDFFIVCHGDSNVQVSAIAHNISKRVKEVTGESPNRMEGTQRGSWVLVDFFDVVVHVFYRETRQFYRLEELWSDAVVTRYENVG